MALGVKIYDLEDGRACLAYYVEGKRRRETFVSKREAQQRAHEVEALKGKGLKVAPRAHAAGEDRASYCQELLAAAGVDKPLTSIVEEYLAATKALGGEGTLIEAAETLRRTRSTQGNRPVVTVAALREEYRGHLSAMGRDADYIQKTCGIYLANFERAFPSSAIQALTSTDLERWWATIGGAGKTRNNYRNAVEALFNFAQARHYLPRGVATEASFLDKAKENDRPADPFTPEEMAILLTESEEADLPFLVLGGFAGIRSWEQARLRWEKHMRWDEGHFELGADVTKMSQRRIVPMLPVAKAWLEPFRHMTGPILNTSHPTRRPGAILRAYGSAWRQNGLRDGYASYRLAAIDDVSKVARELGNSPQMVFNNYLKVVPVSLAERWWGLLPEAARTLAAAQPRVMTPTPKRKRA